MHGSNSLSVRVRIVGKGSVEIGSGNCFGCDVAPAFGDGTILIQPRGQEARVRIGENSSFSNNVAIICRDSITIGNGCQIGDLVAIYDSDFHELDPLLRNKSAGASAPVCLGNNVWLGSRVMVLKGVTIGDNTVVAAMSVVTKSLPATCVAAGVPARIVRDL